MSDLWHRVSSYPCVVYHFYLDLACNTIIMYELVMWTWFLKLLWCACKNLIMASMNLILSML
jgi:hypothetical protein